MDQLYVTSASSANSGESDESHPEGKVASAIGGTSGESVHRHPEGGDLYCIEGLGFTGPERYRFKG